MTKNEVMENAFAIVSYAGDAKASAMQAISVAKEGKIDEARDLIKDARTTIAEAHHEQTKLISTESSGEDLPFSVLLVHGQDHLMTSMTVIDLAEQFIEVYETIANK